MSEFECSQGHLMRSGEIRCKICGGRLARMDGMSGRQLTAIEKEWDREVLRKRVEAEGGDENEEEAMAENKEEGGEEECQ